MADSIFASSFGSVARSLRIFGSNKTKIADRRERFADAAQIFVGKNGENEGGALIAKNFAPGFGENAARPDYARHR